MNGETTGLDMWKVIIRKVIIISLGKENLTWIAVQQFGKGKISRKCYMQSICRMLREII